MSNSSIWVLVADESSASICASNDGHSHLLREVNMPGGNGIPAEQAKRAFAWELMSELCRGAQTQSYDGVIIVAGPDMLEELRRITMPMVRKYLIAEIVGAPEQRSAVQ